MRQKYIFFHFGIRRINMRQKIIKTPKQSVPFVITGIQKTTLTEQNLIAFSGQYKILS